MQKITLYKCDVCGTEYETEEKCAKCEKEHEGYLPAAIIGYHNRPYGKGSPISLHIQLQNGEIWEYSPNRRLSSEEKESN